VIIADGDPLCLRRNTEKLAGMKGISVVASTMDGCELIQKVKNLKVDVVLTELMLKSIDGLGVLEAIGHMNGKRPKTLVLSHVCRDFMVDTALSLGASYYMLKPAECDLVYKRICLLAQEEADEGEKELSDLSGRERIAALLKEIGISPHMKGSRYIQEGALLCGEDKTLLHHLTGKLYPEIAGRFQTTPLNVERAMRTSIQSAWNGGGFLRYGAVTGDHTFAHQRPSAGQLIEWICRKQKREIN